MDLSHNVSELRSDREKNQKLNRGRGKDVVHYDSTSLGQLRLLWPSCWQIAKHCLHFADGSTYRGKGDGSSGVGVPVWLMGFGSCGLGQVLSLTAFGQN